MQPSVPSELRSLAGLTGDPAAVTGGLGVLIETLGVALLGDFLGGRLAEHGEDQSKSVMYIVPSPLPYPLGFAGGEEL